MNTKLTIAAAVLTASMAGCNQNSPPPPTSPSIPPAQELPTKPSENPMPPNTSPSVPPASPQPNTH